MKQEFLIGVNNHCSHVHNINKGKYVYSSKMYKELARTLNNDFFVAEEIDNRKYEKYLD